MYMNAPRTFHVVDSDERIPLLLTLIMVGIRLEREAMRVPRHLYLSAETYAAIATFMAVDSIDKLFGLSVTANLSEDAQPFTIESEA